MACTELVEAMLGRVLSRPAQNHVLVAIEWAEPADVYCMEVEPAHNFVANGVVVHNCIVALEAMAAGTPVVGCKKGALPESVPPQAGVLIGDEDTDVNSGDYLDTIARSAEQVCAEDALFRSLSFAARQRAQFLDYSDVAAQWETDWMERLEARASDPWRLQRHGERIGEREALEPEGRF